MNKAFGTTVKENTMKTTEEVENMVRKAKALESLNELNLSARTKTHFYSKFHSLDEIIWHGRFMSYTCDCYPKTAKKSNKSTLELISALDKAGFIRHDINYGSFCIGRLYRIVFYDKIDATMMPAEFEDLCVTAEKTSSETICHIDYCVGNEKYESFENPTNNQLNAIKWPLRNHLTERSYAILAYRLGFEDSSPHNLEQTGRHFGISGARAQAIETKAIRRIRYYRDSLPAIVPSSDEQQSEVTTIIREIEELRNSPLFKKEAELRQRLFEISKTPFNCANKATDYLDSYIIPGHTVPQTLQIEQLDLSFHAYRCLKCAGIDTVADIIKYPEDDWTKIRRLGRSHMNEIVEKVRAAGYTDFCIQALS